MVRDIVSSDSAYFEKKLLLHLDAFAALANDLVAKAFRRFVNCSLNLIGCAHIVVQRSLFSVCRLAEPRPS